MKKSMMSSVLAALFLFPMAALADPIKFTANTVVKLSGGKPGVIQGYPVPPPPVPGLVYYKTKDVELPCYAEFDVAAGSQTFKDIWCTTKELDKDVGEAGMFYAACDANDQKLKTSVFVVSIVSPHELPGVAFPIPSEIRKNASSAQDPDGYAVYAFWKTNVRLVSVCLDTHVLF